MLTSEHQKTPDFDSLLSSLSLRQIKEAVGKEEFLEYILSLPDSSIEDLLYDWRGCWARPEQLQPIGNWSIWLYLAGRGSGKTRTGAEWIKEREAMGDARFIALVSQSAADARDVMVEGESGILSVYPNSKKPKYEPSKRRVTWPSGATATIYTAEDPDQLRGPSHDTAWVDEPAAYRNVGELWSNLMFGLRLGESKAFVSTTPRAIPFIKDLVKRAMNLDPRELIKNLNIEELPLNLVKDVHVTTGSTYDNKDNLSSAFLGQIITQYEGTRLGRQELNAEILEDVEGALWSRETLDKNRVKEVNLEDLTRIVVAIDPTVAKAENATETGIIVMGKHKNGHGYIVADKSLTASPDGWARQAVKAYEGYMADTIVAEKNNGGEMVSLTINTVDKRVPVYLVWASRGKLTRAEPVAALDEQGKLHIVGAFPKLEDELCTFDGEGDSPNRLDAYVWAAYKLFIGKKFSRGLVWGRGKQKETTETAA